MDQKNYVLVSQEQFGDLRVSIAADPVTIGEFTVENNIDHSKHLPGINPTSSGNLSEFISGSGIRETIKSVIKGFGEDMNMMKEQLGSSKVELELSLGLTTAGWFFVKTEGQVKLKIVWKNKDS